MCGIAGFCNLRADQNGKTDVIEAMLQAILHRGPDAGGTEYCGDDVVLGHRRLSIVDLSETGAQPMTSRSGRMTMVYNGEIYNASLLRERLMAAGGFRQFRGTSDTELLLEHIEAFGAEATLQAAKGMFAAAVYDRESGEILLFRDRIGEKPLYYGFCGKSFVFASELSCLSAFEKASRGNGESDALTLEEKVLPFYFAHGYIPAPYSVYRGIRKLLPGTVLRIQKPYTEETISLSVYWSLYGAARRAAADPFRGSREEAADELERLLRESIRGQMEADVPVGAFLSSGIDSSTIVSLMQDESAGKVRTFTIGMNDPGSDESGPAGAIAAHLGTEHTLMNITEEDAKNVLPLIPGMFSEPFGDSSAIPTYLVSRLTRQHVTVSLSGDAGDELFAGYRAYTGVGEKWGKTAGLPKRLRKVAGTALLAAGKEDLLRRSRAFCLLSENPAHIAEVTHYSDPLSAHLSEVPSGSPLPDYPEIRSLQGTAAAPFVLPGTGEPALMLPAGLMPEGSAGAVRDVRIFDLLLYHPDDILVKVDRTAMAVSLETRVPFLDRDVVEFALSLPDEYLRSGTRGKLVLRDVLKRRVPEQLTERPKKGFSVPLAKWFAEPSLRSYMEDLLSADSLKKEGIIHAERAERLLRSYEESGTFPQSLWYLLMFEGWRKEFHR